MNDVDRGGYQPSRELNEQAALHDVPLCPSHFIVAVDAVRGPGAALALLREHLQLRPTATLVFSRYGGCYFLKLDDVDRFENWRVGLLEAVSIMPFKAGEIFRHEVSTWTAADVAGVEDATGIGGLTALGLISPAP